MKTILKIFIGVFVLLIPYFEGYYAASNELNVFLQILIGTITLMLANVYGRIDIAKT